MATYKTIIEYLTKDKNYLMIMHTFVDIKSISMEWMHRNVCKRLQWLGDKLISDLSSLLATIFSYIRRRMI